MKRSCLFALLTLLSLRAFAADTERQWFTVLLDGRKIGQLESAREERSGQVTTRQSLQIELDRAGTKVAMSSVETSVETTSGEPLAFSNVSQMTGNETNVEGRVENGEVIAKFSNAGATTQRRFAWPRGALLPEGLRLATQRATMREGDTQRVLSFQPSSLDTVEITSTIGARETIALPAGRMKLTRVEQSLAFPSAEVRSTVWLDESREVRKSTMPALGVQLTMIECDEACATSPNQSTNVFERTLVPSPRALTRSELQNGLRYTLAAREHGAELNLAETAEQSVRRQRGKLIVEVRRHARSGIGAAPDPADYAANDWLQSSAPEVVALARRAIGDSAGDAARMDHLEHFVRGYITNKSLGVGYASALEVVRKPEGDCTEHAVLLAALGRSLGIATRVVDGLGYAPNFANAGNVFVPHAWVQAWVDGRWQSYDAALAGFDAGHIAFSAGDGDPWRFYQGLDLLGRIELKRVVPFDASSD
ncbi:MAG: transglutaminase-like domain-containing protein [Dokdonella sp.]